VPEDFDTSIFTNLAQEPKSPLHGFASIVKKKS
jgi:hypothetical protein